MADVTISQVELKLLLRDEITKGLGDAFDKMRRLDSQVDTKKAQASLDELGGAAKRVKGEFKELLSTTGVFGVIGAGGLVAGIVAANRALMQFSEHELKLHYTAKELRVDEETLEKYTDALTVLGQSHEEAAGGIQTALRALNELFEKGRASNIFQELRKGAKGSGVVLGNELIEIMERSGGKPEEALRHLLERMEKMGPQAQAAIKRLFGFGTVGASEILQFLDKLRPRLHVSEEQLKAFRLANINLDISLDNITKRLSVALMPAVESLAHALDQFLQSKEGQQVVADLEAALRRLSKYMASPEFDKDVRGFITGLNEAVTGLRTAFGYADAVIKGMGLTWPEALAILLGLKFGSWLLGVAGGLAAVRPLIPTLTTLATLVKTLGVGTLASLLAIVASGGTPGQILTGKSEGRGSPEQQRTLALYRAIIARNKENYGETPPEEIARQNKDLLARIEQLQKEIEAYERAKPPAKAAPAPAAKDLTPSERLRSGLPGAQKIADLLGSPDSIKLPAQKYDERWNRLPLSSNIIDLRKQTGGGTGGGIPPSFLAEVRTREEVADEFEDLKDELRRLNDYLTPAGTGDSTGAGSPGGPGSPGGDSTGTGTPGGDGKGTGTGGDGKGTGTGTDGTGQTPDDYSDLSGGGAALMARLNERFRKEMEADPALRRYLAAVVSREARPGDEATAVVESIFNRARSEGVTLRQMLSGKYARFFGPINRGKVPRELSPGTNEYYDRAIERALRGSFLTQGATDQGMAREIKSRFRQLVDREWFGDWGGGKGMRHHQQYRERLRQLYKQAEKEARQARQKKQEQQQQQPPAKKEQPDDKTPQASARDKVNKSLVYDIAQDAISGKARIDINVGATKRGKNGNGKSLFLPHDPERSPQMARAGGDKASYSDLNTE